MCPHPLDLLPQTGPARLIRAVLRREEECVECAAAIPPGSSFREAGAHGEVAPALVAIEMGAQAAALLAAREGDARDSRSVRGVIAAVRDVTLHAPRLDANAEYRVVAHAHTIAPPLRIVEFTVRRGDAIVAEGQVTIAGPD